MPYNVTIAAGKNGIVLPNGDSYNAGDIATLTDTQYHSLSAEFKAAYISAVSGADTLGPAGPAGQDAVSAGGAGPSDYGWKAWTYDPLLTGSTTTIATGQVAQAWVRLLTSQTITNIILYQNTGGSGLTYFAAGLYSISGTTMTQVAVTANQSAAPPAGAAFTSFALTAPYVASAGLYSIAVLAVGTTVPVWQRMTNALALAAYRPSGLVPRASIVVSAASSLAASYSTQVQDYHVVGAALS